ncbi:MAG: DGQHR domain-containing protein [Bacteroidales bacterium]|nr:DGQHR domain-containing protein [Bacteroidales bacterium]
MKREIFRFKQNSQEYISFIIPFSEIHNISKVLVYQQDENGYQRKPNLNHINKIKNYILKNLNTFKLPTSIILGIDKIQIEEFIRKNENGKEELFISEINNVPFRTVDGQHRILGLKKAFEALYKLEEKALISNFSLNVITVLTEENARSVELEIFVDINSKGKKVSTDLAELARYNYNIKENRLDKNISSIAEHIAMKTSRELRENDSEGVWNYAIKFDIHSKTNIGIIGVSAFRTSITGIIKNYLNIIDHGLLELEDQELINACDKHAIEIKDFVTKCWNQSVKKKWSNCFKSSKIENEDDDIVNIFFSKNYYIQKPLGAKSINKLIEMTVGESNSLNEAFEKFKKVIDDSKVNSDTWKAGGVFSGLNSEGGFKKIREMITNEKEIPIINI